MTTFEMSEDKPSAALGMTMEHSAFPHLTNIKWQPLHRLAAVSGEFVVTSLLSSATPDHQHQAIPEFMERELAKAKRRVPTPSHSSRNDAVKMEMSTYSATLVATFALALREDYTVASSYAQALTPDAWVSIPEPMEIDAIEAESKLRSTSTYRGPRPNYDNWLRDDRKLGHRAAVCRAPAPVLTSAEVVGVADDTFPASHSKNARGQ
ncbi:unnamed protein product [Phytophthora fragariaefolia]|uniref:Unnamed protein product n=1 Tax=Phytophthora fragariaefolia TaxID=1490495 RepID=A0A9W6Y3C3_9STRA|nr:unnamed protein product [Phytophthora fragariaefolia]